MAIAWYPGDLDYDVGKRMLLKKNLEQLIDSLQWTRKTRPYIEVQGPVSGESGLAIRNICFMESHQFKAFHAAARRIYIETMVF